MTNLEEMRQRIQQLIEQGKLPPPPAADEQLLHDAASIIRRHVIGAHCFNRQYLEQNMRQWLEEYDAWYADFSERLNRASK